MFCYELVYLFILVPVMLYFGEWLCLQNNFMVIKYCFPFDEVQNKFNVSESVFTLSFCDLTELSSYLWTRYS